MDLSVGHANFLCIFQFLVYVLVKQALWCLIFKYQWIERIIKPLEGRQAQRTRNVREIRDNADGRIKP